jgi:hypothetical protein
MALPWLSKWNYVNLLRGLEADTVNIGSWLQNFKNDPMKEPP